MIKSLSFFNKNMEFSKCNIFFQIVTLILLNIIYFFNFIYQLFEF